jgi:hypothetical protein
MALLKTLAGSNQFCSDDHRKRYQDDSNRLALDRLMQAKDRKKGKKSVARAMPATMDTSAPPPPESSFLMETPGQQLPLNRRPTGNMTPIWRASSALYPRVPSLDPNSIFSTLPPPIVQQEFQDAGIALNGGGGSHPGSAGITMASPQIQKAGRPLPRTQDTVKDTVNSKPVLFEQTGSNAIGDGARSEQTVSDSNQDQKQKNRFRLAPREQAGPKFPMAGPMDSRDFLPLAEGNVPLEPYSLDVIHFPAAMALGELALDKLTTTGFEGLDELIAEYTPAQAEPEPEPVVAPGPARTAFVPVACKPVAPVQAKIIQGYPPLPTAAPEVGGDPTFDIKPLRPRMVLGPNPNAPKPAPPPPVAAAPVQATPIVQKPVQTTPVVSTPVVSRPSTAIPVTPISQPVKPPMVKPAQVVQPAAAAPAVKPAAAPAPAPRPVPQPTITVKPPATPTVTVRPPVATPQQVPQRPAAAASAAAVEKPVAAPEPVQKPAAEAAPPAPVKATPTPAPVPEKPKISIRPASTPIAAPTPAPAPQIDRDKRPAQRPVPTAPSRPAMAARDGNALTAERPEPETAPAPQLKPKLMPIRKSEPAYSTSIAVEDFPTLGMHQMEPSAIGKFWSNATAPVKAGAIAAVAAIVLTGGYFIFKPGKTAEVEVAGPTAITEGSAPGMIIGGGGWTTNWGSDAPINKSRQISLFRPSMSMTDYRFEFRGQIEKKAIGWIFRASNSKNYHVAKIEIIKPGLNPIVALVKYSVIKGQEGTHTQVMLPNEFKMDSTYKIRMDVQGDKFTTYVQEKLVDYWISDQVKTGGAGFVTDRGERAQIKSSQIAYLGPSKQ